MMMCPQQSLRQVQAVEVNEPEEVSVADGDTDTVISESPDLNAWENLERPFPAREREMMMSECQPSAEVKRNQCQPMGF